MDWLQELDRRFPVRKSREQKDAFLRFAAAEARKMGYPARVEENGRHRNLTIGHPEDADVLFTAHYDTPARKPLPSLILPRNLPLFLLFQLLGVALLLGVSFGAGYLCFLLTGDARWTLPAFLLCYFALLLLLAAGPANPRNVNCNTSGVAAVLELMEKLPPDAQARAAFVLFDNGEIGRMGSRAYAARHPELKKRALVFNMDCVGLGDHLLIMVKNFARANTAFPLLLESLRAPDGLQTHVYPDTVCAFASDHQSFRCGVNATACLRRRLIGYYTPYLHTPRDTRTSPRNLRSLTDALVSFVKSLAEN